MAPPVLTATIIEAEENSMTVVRLSVLLRYGYQYGYGMVISMAMVWLSVWYGYKYDYGMVISMTMVWLSV